MTSRKIPESAVENLVSDLEGKANVANTVTTNTTQTITGQKVLTTELLRKSTVIDITTQSEKYTSNNGFRFVDKNGQNLGWIENAQLADGKIQTAIHAKNKDGYQQNIRVVVPPSGTTGAYATAPNTPDNAPANAIVTKDKIANMVTTNTVQTISGVKTFNSGTLQALRPILLKEDNANEGGQIHFQRSNNSVLKDEPYIDLWKNIIRFIGINSNNALNITLQVDLENKQVWVPTPALTANDDQAATTAWVRNFSNPTGTIIVWSTSTPPAGYLICNGAAVSRTTYAALFKVIGTTWGAGDGNTTFNLPNLYLLSDIKVKGYTALGLTTYSAPNVPSSQVGNIYRFNEPAGASGPFVMFNQNVQNQGIGLTSDVNNTGLAYNKTTFQTKFCIRY